MRLEELKRIHCAGFAGCERKRRDPLGDHQCPPFPLRMPSQWTTEVRLFEVHDLLLLRPPLPQSSNTKSSSIANFRNSYNEHARSKEPLRFFFAPPSSLSSEPSLNSLEAQSKKKDSSFRSRSNPRIFLRSEPRCGFCAHRCLRSASIILLQRFERLEISWHARFIIVTVTMRSVFLRARSAGKRGFQVLDSAFLLTLSKA